MKLFDKIKEWLENKNVETYWQQAAKDIILFRKGKFNREDLSARYPDLHCTRGWRQSEKIEDAVSFTIPASCPLPLAAQIIVNSVFEPFDKCLVDNISLKLNYCPKWEKLPQIGELSDICDNKKSVCFQVWKGDSDYIDIRYCIKMGDHGDEDGYGMGPATWLVAFLNKDGSWRIPWFIEE